MRKKILIWFPDGAQTPIGSRRLRPQKQKKNGKNVLAVRKNTSRLKKIIFSPLCSVWIQNSTCAQTSCSALSVSGMLWAAVVRRCHGNPPVFFFRGARQLLGCVYNGWNATPRKLWSRCGVGCVRRQGVNKRGRRERSTFESDECELVAPCVSFPATEVWNQWQKSGRRSTEAVGAAVNKKK